MLADALNGIGLFPGLSLEEVEVLARHAELREHAPNQIIARRGFPRQSVGVLLDGVVTLTQKNARERREAQIATEAGPAFLGLAEWALEVPWAHTVRAVTACSCVFIDEDIFARIAGGQPELMSSLLRSVARRGLQSEAELAATATFDTRSRVLRFVLRYGSFFGERRGAAMSLTRPLRQAEIANALGLTRKTVQRTLAPLRQAGLVCLTPDGRWTLSDVDALHRLLPRDPIPDRGESSINPSALTSSVEPACVSSVFQ